MNDMMEGMKFLGHALLGICGSLIVALSFMLLSQVNDTAAKVDRLTQNVYDLRADVKVLQDRSLHK